ALRRHCAIQRDQLAREKQRSSQRYSCNRDESIKGQRLVS
ncbi:hypothetical protein GCK32_019090, partial [Trichostrongylus colubriformis]